MNHSPERIPVRKPVTHLPADIPRHWLGGDMFKTHFANTLGLLFPDAEMYFVRTVKKFLDFPLPERLKKDVLSFIGQEMQHKRTHEKVWAVLEKQGFQIHPFLEACNYISFQIIEKLLDDRTNLAIVAGLEHFTAILSEFVLENGLLRESEPNLRNIYQWHAAEELEHKHVAYELWETVDGDPMNKISGMLIATLLFLGYSGFGIVNLFLQDDPSQWNRILEETRRFFLTKDKALQKLFFCYLEYFHPEFHPSHKNTAHLTQKVIQNMDFEPVLNTKAANVAIFPEKKDRTSF